MLAVDGAWSLDAGRRGGVGVSYGPAERWFREGRGVDRRGDAHVVEAVELVLVSS